MLECILTRAWFLSLSAGFLVGSASWAATPPPPVLGHIDSQMKTANGEMIFGWACNSGSANSVQVDVWGGNPSTGSAVMVATALANRPSEVAVANACKSTGAAYRFAILVPQSALQAYSGQKIYVTGASNLTPISNSGTLAMLSPTVLPTVSGWVDALKVNGDSSATLYGWSCVQGFSGAVSVNVFAGNASVDTSLSYLLTAIANQPSAPGVASACNSTGTNYRFAATIPPEVAVNLAQQQIVVQGPFGVDMQGVYTMPTICGNGGPDSPSCNYGGDGGGGDGGGGDGGG